MGIGVTLLRAVCYLGEEDELSFLTDFLQPKPSVGARTAVSDVGRISSLCHTHVLG